MERKRVLGLLVCSLFIILIAALYYFDVARFISLSQLQKHSAFMVGFVSRYYFLSVVLYILFFTAMIACSLPVTGPLTLLGGFLFGSLRGALFAITGATMGVAIAFLLFRRGLSSAVHTKHAKRLETFKSKMKEHGVSYLLLLHFLTVVPYAVINMLAALAGISLWVVVWTTVVGFIPTSFIYAFAGSQFMTITSMGDIFSPNIIIAFVLLALLAFLPILIKRLKKGATL